MSEKAHDRRRELAAIVLFTLTNVIVSLEMGITQPLSVDLANHLHFKTTELNYVLGAHAVGAGVGGIVGAFVLDRVGRGLGFVLAVLGVAAGSIATACSVGLGSLVAARLLAGWFDCFASALAGALILDEIPFERRGRGIGIATSVSGLASMLLIPGALYVTRVRSFRFAFIGIAGLAITTAIYAGATIGMLSSRPAAKATPLQLPRLPLSLALSYTIFGIEAIVGGLFAPFVVPYVLKNLGYPRDRLEWMFLGIGITAAIAATVAGWLTDRIGGAWMMSIGGIGCIAPTFYLVVSRPTWTTIPFVLGGFVIANLIRNSGLMVLSTRAARDDERAQFTSVIQTLFHVGTVVGIGIGSWMIAEDSSGGLAGGPSLLAVASVLIVLVVPLGWVVQRKLPAEALLKKEA